jgi:hypothetical protein
MYREASQSEKLNRYLELNRVREDLIKEITLLNLADDAKSPGWYEMSKLVDVCKQRIELLAQEYIVVYKNVNNQYSE